MTHRILTLPACLFFICCGKPASDNDEHNGDTDTVSTNQALYDQVMDIHDEVMPKMQDIYNLKKQLQDKIASTPDMVDEERKRLEKRIANVDSVAQMMMNWMHHFNPLPDSADQEAAREYLESEMEKIRQVREAMLGLIKEEGMTFSDFITRFKSRLDVTSFEGQPYYQTFMTLNYGGPISMMHLVSSDELQVFLAEWSEMETDFNHVWTYNSNGDQLSSCPGLPVSELGSEIKEIKIDTVSLDPVQLNFRVLSTTYKVLGSDGEARRGEKLGDRQIVYQLNVDNKGACNLAVIAR